MKRQPSTFKGISRLPICSHSKLSSAPFQRRLFGKGLVNKDFHGFNDFTMPQELRITNLNWHRPLGNLRVPKTCSTGAPGRRPSHEGKRTASVRSCSPFAGSHPPSEAEEPPERTTFQSPNVMSRPFTSRLKAPRCKPRAHRLRKAVETAPTKSFCLFKLAFCSERAFGFHRGRHELLACSDANHKANLCAL